MRTITFKLLLLALPIIALIGCSASPQSVVSDASKAMGGDNLKSIEYSATGFAYVVGQAASPTLPWPKFNAKSYTRAINYETPALRQTLVRTQFENPPHGGGNQPIIGENSATITTGGSSPWAAQSEIWITPHGFLKGAAANNATLASQSVDGKQYNVLSFTAQGKYKFNGYVNSDNMVEKVETWVDNPVLGDMPVVTTYSDYKDFGGVKFPSKIMQTQGGYPSLDVTVNDVKVNTDPKIEVAPAADPGSVTSEKIANGVYFLRRGNYNSVVVEFNDHIAVIEGPLSDEQSTLVIAETKKLVPNKPIKYVVNSHQHFDHAGGLRPFVAEGATIVTHEMNKPYYEKTLAMPHTLAAANIASKTPTFETLTDKKVLTDGKRTLEIHLIQGNPHNDAFLMAYLPAERILVEADAFTPPPAANTPRPNPPSPAATNMADNLQRLKIDYQTILPLHGRKSTRAEYMRWIAKS